MVGAQFGGVLIRTRLARNGMDEDRFIYHGKESGFYCSERLLRGLMGPDMGYILGRALPPGGRVGRVLGRVDTPDFPSPFSAFARL